MPFSFLLPTTSALSYSSSFRSDSHPSLIFAATTRRSVLRSALKKHKRLPITAQATNLNDVLLALNEYVPYLLALDSGLAGKPVNGEEVDVILESELEVEWRPSLAATIPGKETPRVKGRGLDYELSFVLTTIAYTYTLLAKVQLRTLYAASTPAPEQRATAINVAIKFLLQAHGIHGYLSSRSHEVQYPPAAVDISGTTQGALASLSMAEATILATLKDDPYPAIVAQSRNKDDYEWMIKAPEIPKVRAHLFGRLALAAATHAGQAYALLQANDTAKGKTVSQSLLKYSEDFQNTSRAKACRFFGVDSELSGNYGVAIAWLIGGMGELRIKYTEENGAAAKGLAKLKKDWTERREDKKIEKGTEWGNDAGRLEEGRIIEMLEVKWNKTNNVIGCQQIPPSDALVAKMPSGREIHAASKHHNLPSLDVEELTRMRAPPDPKESSLDRGTDDSSDDESTGKGEIPGAFPESSTYF